ncbi:MAG: hypothetical protein IPG99_10775 [Ignavibacteria bacterium]|nr:hypothetical protein [Ignavibacteria bacterium]
MRKILSSVSIMLLLAGFMYGCSGSSTPEVKKPSFTNQISKDLGMTSSQTEAGLGAMMMVSKTSYLRMTIQNSARVFRDQIA